MVLQREMTGSTRLADQRRLVREVRQELVARYRARLQTTNEPPIRLMASIVQALEHECADRRLDPAAVRLEIVNRTIGDVNVRLVTECEGEPGGPGDYRRLADELGVALPGEELSGHVATGAVYRWLREEMLTAEREVMRAGFDARSYDLASIGNPVLRGWLAEDMRQWGLPVTADNVALGLGATDCMDKVLRGLGALARLDGRPVGAVLMSTPGFNVLEGQAVANGYRVHRVPTGPEDRFNLTAAQLAEALDADPGIGVVYLMVTNNPATFAYRPDELLDLLEVLRRHRRQGRVVRLMADLAYVGTGDPAADDARMRALASATDLSDQLILISSLSKTHTLTGERFGWVTFGSAAFAAGMVGSWINSIASMPGEWQLRFMAYHRLFRDNPHLVDKIRRLYALRRTQLRAQLHRLDDEFHLFEHIYLDDDATIYTWCRLRAGEDCFSVLEKTGIAGIPGSTFGYSDDYVRFSVGILPVASD
ncbi:pyridoxal phosphate-dependent aminotransferase [Micromonospora mirobrigensis]|uniref:Aspartate/methionine/tyrosine aminotransferase n=1 Tax=Micromonospora mirobrigensis TaxID=262898 RepID=A0A1C4V2Q4_9ACTN|nr:pyridoxal phosphate-dependent aminotransferase [Micromonospora mirobrigensis]SCE78213.1 Aspartate/methionine/tyrosine aminotransferase [Micromonospora mirobrigensis]